MATVPSVSNSCGGDGKEGRKVHVERMSCNKRIKKRRTEHLLGEGNYFYEAINSLEKRERIGSYEKKNASY